MKISRVILLFCLLIAFKVSAVRPGPFTCHYEYRGSTIALTGDNGVATDRMEYSLYATMIVGPEEVNGAFVALINSVE